MCRRSRRRVGGHTAAASAKKPHRGGRWVCFDERPEKNWKKTAKKKTKSVKKTAKKVAKSAKRIVKQNPITSTAVAAGATGGAIGMQGGKRREQKKTRRQYYFGGK